MRVMDKRTGYKKIDEYTDKVVTAVKFVGYFDWRHFKAVPERLVILTEKTAYEYSEYGKFQFALPKIEKFS